MFNKQEKERIWKNLNLTHSGIVRDGNPIDYHSKELEIPSIEGIALKAITDLQNSEFIVKRVSPKKANCIIRVFRKENIQYDGDLYWVYGSFVFLKNFLFMHSENNIPIDYSEFRIRKILFQDEYFIMKPDFVDYYFKVTKS